MYIKGKIKTNKHFKALCLVILAPVAAANWVDRHKKGLLISIAITVLLYTTCLIFSCGKEEQIYGNVQIKDVSAAFRTCNIRQKTEYIAIHHTAGSDNGKINEIAKIHLGEHQWSTVGYHYFIDVDGTIYQLKPDNEVAPHSFHYNDNSVAIVLNGNFNNKQVPEAQYKALVLLTRQMMAKYNISKSAVLRHCDLQGNNTECPGKYFNLEQFRNDL